MKNLDRYYLFRKLMDLVGEDFEITDADMNNYAGEIEIFGASPEGDISITVRLMEVKENAQELE